MKKRNRLLLILITLPFAFALFAFWGSVGDSNLESYVKEKAGTQITSVETYSFGKAGLVAVAEDQNGQGEVFTFVRLVPGNRYQETKSFAHDNKVAENFAGMDIYNAYSLSLDYKTFKVQSETTNIGYLWILFFKLLAGLLLSAAITVFINIVFLKNGELKNEEKK
jgi:hypothetical protein